MPVWNWAFYIISNPYNRLSKEASLWFLYHEKTYAERDYKTWPRPQS